MKLTGLNEKDIYHNMKVLKNKYRITPFQVGDEVRYAIEQREGLFRRWIPVWYSLNVDTALDVLNSMRDFGHVVKFPSKRELDALKQVEKIQKQYASV